MHGLLGDAAALDDEVRPAVEQLAQVNALVRQAGEDQLAAKQHQQRNEPVAQRQGRVLQWNGRDVRDEHGHHQLGQFQLAELPLAHEAHGHDERKKMISVRMRMIAMRLPPFQVGLVFPIRAGSYPRRRCPK